MSAPWVVGVDIGTSSVKAGVYTAEGRAVITHSIAAQVDRHADGSVTQDLDALYRSAADAVSACMASPLVEASAIAAIAFDGQMAGVGLVDAEHRPVAAYDSWLDSRCGVIVEGLPRDVRARVLELSGCAPTLSIGPKMAWWARYHPELLAKSSRFVTAAGYVAGRAAGLSGAQAFIDPTYLHFASVADTGAGAWDSELAAALGIPEDHLPTIVDSTQIIGHLTPDMAGDFSLPQGLPIAAGCGDTAACAVGAGVNAPFEAFDVAGTAAVLGVQLPSFRADPAGTLLTMRAPLSTGSYALAYVGGAGEIIDWLCRVILGHDTVDVAAYEDLAASAALAPAGADELLVSPHFSGRVAPVQPWMRGAIVGLSPQHGRPHLARAVLESIAYEYRFFAESALALLPPGTTAAMQSVVGTGGGSALGVWNDIKATTLGVPYTSLPGVDAGTRGAAMLALAAVGATTPLPPTGVGQTHYPDASVASAYDSGYARYREWTARLAEGYAAPRDGTPEPADRAGTD